MTEQQSKDLALSALVLLAQFHRIPVNSSQIKHQFDTQGQGLSETQWLLAAKSLGFKTKTVSKTVERLPFLNLPALGWRDDGKHFIFRTLSRQNYSTNFASFGFSSFGKI